MAEISGIITGYRRVSEFGDATYSDLAGSRMLLNTGRLNKLMLWGPSTGNFDTILDYLEHDLRLGEIKYIDNIFDHDQPEGTILWLILNLMRQFAAFDARHILTETIDTEITVGSIHEGTILPQGTTITDVFKKMFLGDQTFIEYFVLLTEGYDEMNLDPYAESGTNTYPCIGETRTYTHYAVKIQYPDHMTHFTVGEEPLVYQNAYMNDLTNGVYIGKFEQPLVWTLNSPGTYQISCRLWKDTLLKDSKLIKITTYTNPSIINLILNTVQDGLINENTVVNQQQTNLQINSILINVSNISWASKVKLNVAGTPYDITEISGNSFIFNRYPITFRRDTNNEYLVTATLYNKNNQKCGTASLTYTVEYSEDPSIASIILTTKEHGSINKNTESGESSTPVVVTAITVNINNMPQAKCVYLNVDGDTDIPPLTVKNGTSFIFNSQQFTFDRSTPRQHYVTATVYNLSNTLCHTKTLTYNVVHLADPSITKLELVTQNDGNITADKSIVSQSGEWNIQSVNIYVSNIAQAKHVTLTVNSTGIKYTATSKTDNMFTYSITPIRLSKSNVGSQSITAEVYNLLNVLCPPAKTITLTTTAAADPVITLFRLQINGKSVTSDETVYVGKSAPVTQAYIEISNHTQAKYVKLIFDDDQNRTYEATSLGPTYTYNNLTESLNISTPCSHTIKVELYNKSGVRCSQKTIKYTAIAAPVKETTTIYITEVLIPQAAIAKKNYKWLDSYVDIVKNNANSVIDGKTFNPATSNSQNSVVKFEIESDKFISTTNLDLNNSFTYKFLAKSSSDLAGFIIWLIPTNIELHSWGTPGDYSLGGLAGGNLFDSTNKISNIITISGINYDIYISKALIYNYEVPVDYLIVKK